VLADQLARVGRLDVLREDEHAERRLAPARLDRRTQALVAEAGTQAPVADRQCVFVPRDRPQQSRAILHLGDHLDLMLAQECDEALPQQRKVRGDHYPHGMLTSTIVPAPLGLLTLRLPSSASTRARRPASPDPSGSAPPRPSSPTCTSSARRSSVRRTQLLAAAACLAVFVSASATTK